jgi:hypothetical protein
VVYILAGFLYLKNAIDSHLYYSRASGPDDGYCL